MFYIGIDPGKKGAIVVITRGKIVHKEIMPLIGGDEVNYRKISSTLLKLKTKGTCHIVTEKFAGFFGYSKSAAISIGSQVAVIRAIGSLLGIPVTSVIPKTWQGVICLGTKMYLKKDGRKDNKKIALITASRLFPEETFLASTRSKVPHDGYIDAALIALYGYKKGL